MNRDVAASLRSQGEALGVAVYCPAGRVLFLSALLQKVANVDLVLLAKISVMNAGYHALSVHENVKACCE
jgi:hypothetical protein